MLRVTSKKAQRPNAGCLALFFGVFALVGSGLFWVLGIRPLVLALDARSWAQAPATIVTSMVEQHSGSKGGSTFNVAMTFDYRYEGKTYRGTRYDFQTGSSSGRDAKQAVVDRFPPGTETTCWVNPANPAQAVIDRNLGWWILFGFFPLLFLGAGLGGLVGILGAWRGRSRSEPPAAFQITSQGEIRPS